MTTNAIARLAPIAAALAAVLGAFSGAAAQDTTARARADLIAPSNAAARDTSAHVLTIGEAARLAARQGAIALGARYRAEEAEARVTQRRADLLPNLSGAASDTRHTMNSATFGIDFPSPPGQPPLFDPNGSIIGPIHIVDGRVRASQSLLDFGAIERWRASQASARSSNADANATADQAAALAANSYILALRTEATVEARTADSVLADELLHIAQQQLKAGVGVALDVTRAQSQLAGIRAQLIASRNQRDRAKLDLLRALGLPLGANLVLADSLTTAGTDAALPTEDDAIATAFQRRADLRAADLQLTAATRGIAAVRAERLPTLGVFGDDGVTGKTYDHLLNTYQYGVQVSVPILDGFRREGRIDEQRAMAQEVEVRRRDLRQEVAIEVQGALLDLSSAREQVDAVRERLRFAEQELQQARERFRAGVAGNADVVTASLSLDNSRTLLIDALTSYQSARVALARAEGTVTQLP